MAIRSARLAGFVNSLFSAHCNDTGSGGLLLGLVFLFGFPP